MADENTTTDQTGSDGASSNGTVTGGGDATNGTQEQGTQKSPEGERANFHINRLKDELAKVKAERDSYKNGDHLPKKYSAEEDPTGDKELSSLLEAKLEQRLKDLGLDEKIQKIEYEKQQEEFFGEVFKVADDFKALGITVTKDDLINALTTFDEKGLAPKHLFAIAKVDEFLNSVKPKGFSAGDGTKPNNDRPVSNEEIRSNIYKKHGVFGFGK